MRAATTALCFSVRWRTELFLHHCRTTDWSPQRGLLDHEAEHH
jgi:hypothetical protein